MFIVQIAGHLGKDPETRFTPSGQKVTTFNMAVNQRKGKEDVTLWVRTTVWGDRFDKMISYLKKGSAVIVMGRMNPPSTYVDKEGRTQVSIEVTAEMIEFSPFGKTDRQGEGQSYSLSSPGSASNNGMNYNNNTADNFTNSQGSKPQFAQSSQFGQGNSYGQSSDEDDLPF